MLCGSPNAGWAGIWPRQTHLPPPLLDAPLSRALQGRHGDRRPWHCCMQCDDSRRYFLGKKYLWRSHRQVLPQLGSPSHFLCHSFKKKPLQASESQPHARPRQHPAASRAVGLSRACVPETGGRPVRPGDSIDSSLPLWSSFVSSIILSCSNSSTFL